MTQIPYFNPSIPQDFQNRKVGLVTFGIIMIVLGSLCGCVAALSPIGLLLQSRFQPAGSSKMAASGLISAIPMYAGLATGLIWCGIGSIQARRWVRPIVLIFSTIWICIGAISFLGVLYTMTGLGDIVAAQQAAASRPAPPAGAIALGALIGVGVTLIIYIVIPGALVWFYRGADVERTLHFYDPTERWTDRCPLPVLGMSIVCALSAAACLAAIPRHVAWVFGTLLTGWNIVLLLLVIASVLAIAAVSVYRRHMLGWNLALVTVGLMMLSMIVSAFNYDSQKVGIALGATTQELQVLRAGDRFFPILNFAWPIILGVTGIVYAMRIRHYFREPEPMPPSANPADMR